MADIVEFECNSCGAVSSIEVAAPGDMGSEVRFCPVCGEELEEDDDDDDDFWGLDEDEDED
jgi:transcription initiation factor IIE alpha subunit